jgi:hypothetical protein
MKEFGSVCKFLLSSLILLPHLILLLQQMGRFFPVRNSAATLLAQCCYLSYNPETECPLRTALTGLAQSVKWLVYGLDNGGSWVWLPTGARNFSLLHCVEMESAASPVSCPLECLECFPREQVGRCLKLAVKPSNRLPVGGWMCSKMLSL